MNAHHLLLVASAIAAGILSGCAQTTVPITGQTTPAETPAQAEPRYTRELIVPPSAVSASRPATPPAVTSGRGNKPLHTVTGKASGQAGYVHYFLLRMPDETLEVQVGIELADQRIAWSFPDLGVVISPFIDGGDLHTGTNNYAVWHLYGVRPFPDDAVMTRLQNELPGRIAPWLRAQTPYCLDDEPKRNCMSCLGFVLRALFPGRGSEYPAIPRDFSHTINPTQFTPNDLLLYLAGMLDLPDRNTRLQRLSRLTLPADLREDLEELVRRMGNASLSPRTAAPLTARQKRTGGNPTGSVAPQTPRRKP